MSENLDQWEIVCIFREVGQAEGFLIFPYYDMTAGGESVFQWSNDGWTVRK